VLDESYHITPSCESDRWNADGLGGNGLGADLFNFLRRAVLQAIGIKGEWDG
jgi:hypothetical protein